MMKTNSNRWFKAIAALCFASLLAPTTALAQDDDFGYDLSVEGETKIASGLKLEMEAGMRTQNDAEDIDRYTVGAALSYKLYQTTDKKFSLKSSAGFEYLWTQKLQEKDVKYFDATDELVDLGYFNVGDQKGYNISEKYWRNRYRINVGLNASYDPNKRWSFSLKETVQYGHYCNASTNRTKWRIDEYNSPELPDGTIDWQTTPWQYNDEYMGEDYKDAEGNVIGKTLNKDVDQKYRKDRTTLRSKLSASYDIRNFPIDLFASVDYGVGLNYTANKWKFTVGYDLKINKTNKLSVYYRYTTEDDDDEVNGHIVGLGYKFEL